MKHHFSFPPIPLRLAVPALLAATLLTAALLAACGGASSSGADEAAAVVEGYFQALNAKDVNTMIAHSCADWEAPARQEYDSFAAVETTLEGPECQTSGTEGETTLVACTGTIIASYGNEDLEIDLSERTYQVIEEGGEWRLCGYR